MQCRRGARQRHSGVITVCLFLFALRASAAQTPHVDYKTFLALDRPSPRQAAAAWTPTEGSPAAEPARFGTVPGVRLRCELRDPATERASWDVPIKVDLRLARGIRFQFRCRNLKPVSRLNLYFRSRSGWYAATLQPTSSPDWQTLEVLKSNTGIEGRPNGWGRIDTMRISAWRGEAGTTTLELAGFGVVHPTARAAVVRAVALIPNLSTGDARGVIKYAERVSNALDRFGVKTALLEDLDIGPGTLAPLRLLILPFYPDMPAAVRSSILGFVRDGGQVLGFYTTPPELATALGFRPGNYVPGRALPHGLSHMALSANVLPGTPPLVRQASGNLFTVAARPDHSEVAGFWVDARGDPTEHAAVVVSANGSWVSHVYLGEDPVNGPQLLLALAARHLPDAWKLAAVHTTRDMASALDYRSFPQAVTAMQARSRAKPAAAVPLRSAAIHYNRAREQIRAGRHAAAFQSARKAEERLLESYAMMEPAGPTDEFRGAWCHRGFGIRNWSWEQSAAQFARYGFQALFVNLATADTAYYPSRVLDADPYFSKHGDQLAECLQACRRRGIELHVWKVCFRSNRETEAGCQRNAAGDLLRQWRCPSDPANRRREVQATVEIARNYPVRGIHLDYIRYPSRDSCFCTGCRQRFEAELGRTVRNWPNDVRRDPGLDRAWAAFRRRQITSTVREIRAALRAVRPELQLSAAVFGDWPGARRSVAQDWVEWCRSGLVDFVCPMNYTDDPETFRNLLRRQIGWTRGTGASVYPGIGLSANELRRSDLIKQIRTTRTQNAGGFLIFEYDRAEAETAFPFLGTFLTRPQR